MGSVALRAWLEWGLCSEAASSNDEAKADVLFDASWLRAVYASLAEATRVVPSTAAATSTGEELRRPLFTTPATRAMAGGSPPRFRRGGIGDNARVNLELGGRVADRGLNGDRARCGDLEVYIQRGRLIGFHLARWGRLTLSSVSAAPTVSRLFLEPSSLYRIW